MENDSNIKINQIELISAILNEIDKQNNGILLSESQINTIIKSANLICEAFNKNHKPLLFNNL